jgi:hypothetical protein
MAVTKQQALEYQLGQRPGKVAVVPSKPSRTQLDLSLAYTPGVAIPCVEIENNPHDAFKYTARGNLVAVISNGTAVLGLGDIGALAGKPLMEGKGVLFKRFADVDVFDLEVNSHNPNEVIRLCHPGTVPPAPAPRHDAFPGAETDHPSQYLRFHDAARGRCRSAGLRSHAAFPRHDSARSRNRSRPRRTAQGLRAAIP